MRTIGGSAFSYCLNLTSIKLIEGVVSTGQQWIWGSRNIALIDLPSTMKTLTGYGIQPYDSSQVYFIVICRAVTPPSLGSNGYLSRLTAVYVPNESVSAYKAASVWSGIAAKIKPLSEYIG